jgi:hypothetical protein
MTWAQRLKRVFNIDVETCTHCGGSVKVIACIENPVVIRKILSHLLGKALSAEPVRLPKSRAPPQAGCSADTRETYHSAQMAATLTEAAGHRLV